ncbi:MAG: class I SAM-dependent methyltransferase [Candidatus Omnitrophica bacterium]|nr:class I SAM-dependent methyltransferase [Candidatus Omnitrophota bacterium]
MRKIDFQKDQMFYDQSICPSTYKKDYLDIYRFNLVIRLLKLKFRETLENKVILNVGGGYGREAYLMFSAKPNKIIIIDHSFNQLIQAERYLKEFSLKYFICGDGENLPVKDKSVDVCVINETLHHFINPLKGINESMRVAKKIIILDEPQERSVICRLLEFIFRLFRIKEKFERGYLEPFRINRKVLEEFSTHPKIKILYYPYFIYYFKWYKNIKIDFIKSFYYKFLIMLNLFFHFLGNRVIIVICKDFI